MEKFDLKKTLPDYFKASPSKFSVVKLPKFNYLMVDGKGDPNTSHSYLEAIELLYGISYTLKFMSKDELGRDYVVPPLEGLWWAKDLNSFEKREKSKWSWTMIIMVPNGITKAFATKAIKTFKEKKPEANISKIRFDSLTEGLSVQILHVGPYDAEGQVLARMHKEFMPENNYVFNGIHHEIYLGDPRKTSPEKLKTILRQPVKKK
ncbi:unannotated protein [freshwater metagenome]|uniref:Unannotated protein n=1 Tax=freshwater metagenome TaxID=449393 RepID=A0A6J7MA82_9ZZZZ|nr:hypothetical protein [Actinomycetota bacterium]MSX90012.1 hypothetical protein [Actinomycetota bacterium]MSZ64079.1 hypothetical protein [Actinomycetota bacterium]MTA58072.1 hypothetical protein [Actinomycetota bacterium]